jgi:hypothetical protein
LDCQNPNSYFCVLAIALPELKKIKKEKKHIIYARSDTSRTMQGHSFTDSLPVRASRKEIRTCLDIIAANYSTGHLAPNLRAKINRAPANSKSLVTEEQENIQWCSKYDLGAFE